MTHSLPLLIPEKERREKYLGCTLQIKINKGKILKYQAIKPSRAGNFKDLETEQLTSVMMVRKYLGEFTRRGLNYKLVLHHNRK
jgi:hypothetical protein